MMKAGIILGASAAALAAVAACSSFDSTDAPGGGASDGGLLPDGAPTPVTGQSTGDVAISVTVAPLVHGRKATVPFTITRGFNYSASILVRADGLPSTITAPTVIVPEGSLTGELTLDVGLDTPYGPIRGATIVAVGQTSDKPSQSQPYEPEVRGAPGELDTSFGTGGVLAIDNADRGAVFALDGQGRILVQNNVGLRRFDTEGRTADTTFSNLTLVTGQPSIVAVRGQNIFVARSKPFNDSGGTSDTVGARIWKLNLDGSPDTLYGTGGRTEIGGDGMSVFGIDVDGRAISFGPSFGNALQTNYTPNGVVNGINSPKVTGINYLRGIVYYPDHSAAFAGEHKAGKLLSDNITLDTSFGSNGYYTLPSAVHVNDMIRDDAGNLLLTGHVDSGALYLVRLTATGTPDPQFSPQTTTFKITPEPLQFEYMSPGPPITDTVPFAGHLAIGSGGTIYLAAQSGSPAANSQCVVARFLPNGSIDTSFGENGVTTLGPKACFTHSIAVRDGKIFVGGMQILRIWE